LALLVFAGMEDEGAKALNAYTWRIRFLFLKHPSLDRLADAPTEGAEAEH
jgi:hypothetical protein